MRQHNHCRRACKSAVRGKGLTMRDEEFLEWERRAYQRSKTRSERRRARNYRAALIFATLLVVLLAVLASQCASSYETHEPDSQKSEFALQPVTEIPGPVGGDVPASGYADIEDLPVQSLGDFSITHYCACEKCCGRLADGITATGTVATQGRTVAVDPSVIPYGTEIEICYEDGSVCRYIAEDCGGAIKGNRIDVFMDSHDEALEMGIRNGLVYISEDVR